MRLGVAESSYLLVLFAAFLVLKSALVLPE